MAVSQTAEYALRAVICLARHKEAQTTQHIAECTGVPQSYLPKVLQPLTRSNLVSAQRGVRGGYTLERKADELSVLEVVNCVDPVGRIKTCPGHPDGPDVAVGEGQGLCPLHQLLDDVLAATERRFAETTIDQLAYDADGSPTLCVPVVEADCNPRTEPAAV